MSLRTFQLFQSRLIFVILTLFLSLFAACSSVPSELKGREFLDNLSKDKYGNLFRVKTFAKTNGIDNDHIYTMEFSAELECLKPNQYVEFDSGTSCESAGQIVKQSGKLIFEKTENGWRVVPGGFK